MDTYLFHRIPIPTSLQPCVFVIVLLPFRYLQMPTPRPNGKRPRYNHRRRIQTHGTNICRINPHCRPSAWHYCKSLRLCSSKLGYAGSAFFDFNTMLLLYTLKLDVEHKNERSAQFRNKELKKTYAGRAGERGWLLDTFLTSRSTCEKRGEVGDDTGLVFLGLAKSRTRTPRLGWRAFAPKVRVKAKQVCTTLIWRWREIRSRGRHFTQYCS